MKEVEKMGMTAFRTIAVALILALGLAVATPAAAQDDATPDAPGVAQVEDVQAEEDEGFDDWGLLGLLGLLGLAGLTKRPDREVRTVDRPVVERTAVDRPGEPRA